MEFNSLDAQCGAASLATMSLPVEPLKTSASM
jgi:hypothetical protein